MTGRASSLSERIARLPLPVRARRVVLLPPSLEHVETFVRLLNDPEIHRGTLHLPYPYTARDARAWVRRALRDRRAGRTLGLSVVRRSDAELLGGVGLHQLEEGAARAEVGYWLGREHWGRGYATEAVNALLRVAFGPLGFHRIEARVYPWNVASCHVAKRCGFRFEGRLRDEVRKDGRWKDTLLFSRLGNDPPVARRRRSSRPTAPPARSRA